MKNTVKIECKVYYKETLYLYKQIGTTFPVNLR